MKYVIRAAPIFVALALLVSFLVIPESKSAEAVIGSIEIGTLATPGDLSSAFTTTNEATSKDPARALAVRVVDDDFATGNPQDGGPLDTIAVTLDSDSSAGCVTSSFLMTELVDTGVFVREFFITDEEDKDPGTDGIDGDGVLDNDPDHLFVAEDLATCGAPLTDVILLAIDGDDVEAEYLESAQTPAGVGLDRYAITMNNDGPVISSLSPADEFFVASDQLSLFARADPSNPDVVEATVFFLLHDEQCTDDDVYWPNGDVRFTVPLLAPDSQFDNVETLVCGAGPIGVDGVVTPARDEDDGVVEITDDKFIDLGPSEFAQRFVSVIAVDEAGNISILDMDTGDDERVFAEYTLDNEDPSLTSGDAFSGYKINRDFDLDGITTFALRFAEVYDTNERNYILVEFNDKDELDLSTVDEIDFRVVLDGEDLDIDFVKTFDKDSVDLNEDVDTTDSLENFRLLVEIKLEEELPADAGSDLDLEVFLVNTVKDRAGNDQSTGEVDVDDKIGPKFTFVYTSPLPASTVLAGDEVEVEFTVTSDEDLKGNEPDVTVTSVENGTVLSTDIDRVGSLNEWDVTVNEPAAATIYSIFIEGSDGDLNTSDLGIDEDGLTGSSHPIFDEDGDVDEDALIFEGDPGDLSPPFTIPAEDGEVSFRNPFFVTLDFGTQSVLSGAGPPEDDEYEEDSHADVTIVSAMLDDEDVLELASTSDGTKWLIAFNDIELGDHELVINAEDEAGNELEDGEFTLEFEIIEREPIEVDLIPGWNLVSLPGQPADPSIDAVMANSPDVEAVITYDPTVPGGFLVALRTEDGGDFSGTLETMVASRGYWVLTDSFDPIEVDVPPLGQGAGVLPPTVPVAEGWNLLPVQDPTGQFESGDKLRAKNYFTSAEDVSAVYDFDTIDNAWVFVDITDETVTCDALLAADDEFTGATVAIGKSYWVFSTEAGTLVPVPISSDVNAVEHTACDILTNRS